MAKTYSEAKIKELLKRVEGLRLAFIKADNAEENDLFKCSARAYEHICEIISEEFGVTL